MHINSLPDLVFRRIFSKVPLHELLIAGCVCTLWKWYQMEIGKQVRSLTILIGPKKYNTPYSLVTSSSFFLKYRDLLLNEDGKKMYSSQYLDKHFHINYDSFTSDCAIELLDIFSRITTLEIAIKDVQFKLDIIHSMISLLVKWSPALKSLKMYFYLFESYLNASSHSPLLTDVMIEDENKLANLLSVINSLSSLEHLTLRYNKPLFTKPSLLRIVGQLREFYFETEDLNDSILQTLKQYVAVNDNLKQLAVRKSPISGEMLQSFYQNYPQLQRKAVYLYSFLGNVYGSSIQNASISKFTSLTLLQLWLYKNENIFTGALNLISSLKQLTHLHIYFPGDYFSSLQFSNKLQVSQIAQLASIKVLVLNTIQCEDYHKNIPNIDSPHNLWSHLFPNVQVIELTLYYCRSPIDEADIRKFLATFVHCTKLRHLYTWEEEINDEADSKLCEWTVLQVGDRKLVIKTKQSSHY